MFQIIMGNSWNGCSVYFKEGDGGISPIFWKISPNFKNEGGGGGGGAIFIKTKKRNCKDLRKNAPFSLNPPPPYPPSGFQILE